MPQDPELVAFLKANPTYPTTHVIDHLRLTEYARLDVNGQIYLDYTGGGLYAESQILRHHRLLSEHVFGNPHSTNPASLASTELVEHAREYILRFFNADPNEYIAIFAANASGALKIVGESYPFDSNSRYLLTFDNHNSVNGIREFAHARGANVTYIPVALPDMRVDESFLTEQLARRRKSGHHLLAFPAQSNFSGVQHPARVDRTRARTRLGRAPRRGRVRPHESTRSRLGQTRLCAGLFLQDVRLPDGTRRAHRAQIRAGETAPSLVSRVGRSPWPRCRAINITSPTAPPRSRMARSIT
jgi:hypothetical protein